MRAAALRVEVRTSGIWQTNSVLLSCAGEVVVVDPAFFPRELDELSALARRRGRRTTVALTHGHWDHVAGWRHFPGARVLGSVALAEAVAQERPVARRNLERLREFDERWYVARAEPAAWPPELHALRDGERFGLGGTRIEALAVPGHSDDGLALWLPQEGLLLPGDYLSACEIPFVEDLAAYRAALARMRDLLPALRQVIPGHGPTLDRAAAASILEQDVVYLEALAHCAAEGDLAAAIALPLPRAVGVPGMGDRHRENCRAAGLKTAPTGT